MRPSRGRAGFTLMELMVVVTIIGILAGFAIPQYLKTIESSRADDAAAIMNMVATTNRMYAIDHSGTYTAGQLSSSCGTSYGACVGGTSGSTNPCELVACKYLAPQDFDSKCYGVSADNPGSISACNAIGGGAAGLGTIACAFRKTANFNGNATCVTSLTPYNGWQYSVTSNGAITSAGTNIPAAISP